MLKVGVRASGAKRYIIKRVNSRPSKSNEVRVKCPISGLHHPTKITRGLHEKSPFVPAHALPLAPLSDFDL